MVGAGGGGGDKADGCSGEQFSGDAGLGADDERVGVVEVFAADFAVRKNGDAAGGEGFAALQDTGGNNDFHGRRAQRVISCFLPGGFFDGDDCAIVEFNAIADEVALLPDADPCAPADGAGAAGAGDGEAVNVGALAFVAGLGGEIYPDFAGVAAGDSADVALLGCAEGDAHHVGGIAEVNLTAANARLVGDGE